MANHYILKSGIGTIDAERDYFLDDYFLETQLFEDLICFDETEFAFAKRVIVGRTGSGKTALLKKINSLPNMKSGSVEAETMIFEHIKNNVFISSLIENNIDMRIFYKTLWLHVLLIKIIELLYPRGDLIASLRGIFSEKHKLAQEYMDGFGDKFFNEDIISEITTKMQTELSGSVSADIATLKANLGGKQNEEITEKIQSKTSKYVSSQLLTKQKQIIKGLVESYHDKKKKFIISIDDLDRSWLNENVIRYDFINALLDAFRELLDIVNVKVLISIRTDILKGVYKKKLRQEEKDSSLIAYVEWKKEEIQNLLDKRVEFLVKRAYTKEGVKFNDLFDFQVQGVNASEYILARTMLRPRDAIEFVNSCLKNVSGNSANLNESCILEAEESFYAERKVALCSEWYSLYPNLRIYLDALSVFDHNEVNLDSIAQKKDSICEILLQAEDLEDEVIKKCVNGEMRDLLNIWFICGVIGREKRAALIIYSNHNKPELDITDYNKNFKVHPLFFRN